MGGGKKSLLATAALAAAGCTADDGKLNVRTIADPMTAAAKRGSPMLAEARSMLALNSVGLALEGFRKALRQQPDSVEALAGIAECYERMGRYDLSRVNYEAALAIAPNNPVLLNTFAVSLQRQGRFAEANALRAEAAEAEANDVAITVRMAQADIVSTAAAAPIVQPERKPPSARPAAAAKPAPTLTSVADKPTPIVGIGAKPAPPVVIAAAKAAPVVPAAIAKPAPAKETLAPVPSPTNVSRPAAKVIHTEVVGNTEWKIEVPKGVATASVRAAVSSARVEQATKAAPIAIPPAPPVPEANAAQTVAPAKPAPVALAPESARDKAVAALEPAPVKPVLTKPAPFTPLPPKVAREVAVAARDPVPVTPTPTKPAPKTPIRAEAPAVATAQPRLERLSMGEVALLTRDAPAWRTEVVSQSRTSITARFVPLKPAGPDSAKMATAKFVPLKSAAADKERLASARFVPLKTAMAANRPNIRLLNAARHQGLAARTRMTLFDRGWRKIAIGDAAQVRARSIVLYPANRQVLGKRLAAQFGFATAINYRSDEVLVLLGRDASALTYRRARG